MSVDPRAQCWDLALDCLSEADKVIKRQRINVAKVTAGELPAVVDLYMRRAQILATLAGVPIDVVQSKHIDDLLTQHRNERVIDRMERRKMRCGNCDGVLPGGCTCTTTKESEQ